MTTRSDHASRDDLAAYTLGSLEEECISVEKHLETCERCSERARWLLPALEVLPQTVEQVEPPPELRKQLVAITRSEAEMAGTAAPRKRLRERRSWLGSLRLVPAGALAAAAIVIAGVGGYALHDDGGPGNQTKSVAVASEIGGSAASLEVSNTGATLQAHNVPQLPPGSIYQVWVTYPGKGVQPSSVFRPARDGTAAAAVPEVLHGANQVMVTREPGRGSTAPTSPVIFSAHIAKS